MLELKDKDGNNRKLREVLEDAYLQDKHVAVGASNGSSYIYIGPVDAEIIDKLFTDYRDRIQNRYDRDYPEMIKRLDKGTSDLSKEEIMENAYNINKLYTSVSRADSYLKYYKPVMGRDVVKASVREEGDVRIIVTGSEIGKYWFEKEYLKDQKKSK